jgi:dTDP-4-amino-4,6-dideoxygalactose transaminase
MEYSIPFNKVFISGNELQYIEQSIANSHVSGDGPFTLKCHAWLKTYFSSPKSLLTTSCTHALEISAMLLDIKPGDEVVIPAFTFVSTVNAFVRQGAKPIFVDIRPDTLNIDESLLEENITQRTRAIIVVHYAGVGCEMDEIQRIASKYDIPVIEDNAHGMFGRYRGQKLGTFGIVSALSFHETKNISCGEGGALIINDSRYIERAEIIREKGTDRSRFFRGQVDKYTWVDIGSSFLPSDMLAAFLYAQLEAEELIQSKRKAIWQKYHQGLLDWADINHIVVPFIPDHCKQPFHMFYLLLPSIDNRGAFIKHLKDQGILSVFHYLPLHLSKMGQKFGGEPGSCPVTEDISGRLVRLPFFTGLGESEQQRVIDTIVWFNTIS